MAARFALKGDRVATLTMQLPTPVGTLTLVAGDYGLPAILWENDAPERVRLGALVEDRSHPVLREAARQLGAYFCGQRTPFDLPLDARGTPFQKKVWDALLAIPYSETRSYGDIAKPIGHPSACRAVGAANPMAETRSPSWCPATGPSARTVP